MQAPLDQAILVLFVGMFSVFLILGLIVLSGQFLIRMTNRFFPVALEQKTRTNSAKVTPEEPDLKSLAAITAAVEVFTRGKGRIVEIEKMD